MTTRAAASLAALKRWRRWIIFFGILVAVRVGLPLALRPILASQASQLLRAHVEVGDVDLALLWGGVALEDVAVRATAEPDAAATPGESPAPPLIAWKRLAVSVYWLPLLRKTVRLRELEIESPRVRLDRLMNGQLNLLALLPGSTEAPAPEATPPAATPPAATPPAEAQPTAAPPAEASAGWTYGLDRFVLRDGGLRFRDFTIKDSEPVEVNLAAVEVNDIALSPGLYGEPARLHVALDVDQGSIRLDARLTVREAWAMAAEAELEVKRLPVHRARVYVPKVGWSALEGFLDAALTYRFDSGTQSELRGTATLSDFTVRVPKIDERALAWRSLTVHIDPVDLVARRVAVTEIKLDGMSLIMRPHGGVLLPLIGEAVAAANEGEATTAPPPAEEAAPGSESPWRWSVSGLRVDDSHVRLLSEQPLDVGVTLAVRDLADQADQPAHVDLTLATAGGSLSVDGALRVTPPGFGGRVRISDLSLPELVSVSGALPPNLLQAGRLGSELNVEAGLAADDAGGAPPANDVRVRGKLSLAGLRLVTQGPQGFVLDAGSIDLAIADLQASGVLPGAGAGTSGTAAGDLRVAGRLSLAELHLGGADAKAFSVGTRALDLPIKELTLPGILATAGANAAARPLRVGLGDLRLTAPVVRLTRTAAGIVLPEFSIASAPSAAPAAAPPAVPQAAPSPRVGITIDSIRLTDGDVVVADRTVKPFFTGGFSPVAVEIDGFRWPELAMKSLHVAATGTERGKIEVFGALAPDGGWLEVNGDKIALPPLNPYATAFAGYSIGAGKLSTTTKVSLAGGNYYASNWLTLHTLDVRGVGGESLFQQNFGIPLSTALALMRDTQGDISLDIPVEVGAEGTKIGLGTVVRSALQRAILGALTSPLKLVGAAFGGGKVESIVPAAIGFRPGRSDIAPDGALQIDQLAALLASRPGIGVTLEAASSTIDERWLREQGLREEWEGQGILGALRGLPQRGTRDNVRRALEARAKDEEGPLDAEDAAALDRWLEERPPIAPERLRALTEARLALVEQTLREQYGIEANRITRHAPAADLVADPPAVHVELGPVGS